MYSQELYLMREFMNRVSVWNAASQQKFVLRGSFAGVLCYGSQRYVDNVDLRCNVSLGSGGLLSCFCAELGLRCGQVSSMGLLKQYGVSGKTGGHVFNLNIHCVNSPVLANNCPCVNGVYVLGVDELFLNFMNKFFMNRDLRSFYDMCSLMYRNWNLVPQDSVRRLRAVLMESGRIYIEGMIRVPDPYVNVQELASWLPDLYRRLEIQ